MVAVEHSHRFSAGGFPPGPPLWSHSSLRCAHFFSTLCLVPSSVCDPPLLLWRDCCHRGERVGLDLLFSPVLRRDFCHRGAVIAQHDQTPRRSGPVLHGSRGAQVGGRGEGLGGEHWRGGATGALIGDEAAIIYYTVFCCGRILGTPGRAVCCVCVKTEVDPSFAEASRKLRGSFAHCLRSERASLKSRGKAFFSRAPRDNLVFVPPFFGMELFGLPPMADVCVFVVPRLVRVSPLLIFICGSHPPPRRVADVPSPPPRSCSTVEALRI